MVYSFGITVSELEHMTYSDLMLVLRGKQKQWERYQKDAWLQTAFLVSSIDNMLGGKSTPNDLNPFREEVEYVIPEVPQASWDNLEKLMQQHEDGKR